MTADFWSHPLTVTVVGIVLTAAGTAIAVGVRVMFEVKGILVGADGKNGVRGEVKALALELKETRHDIRNQLQVVQMQSAAHSLQIEAHADDLSELKADFKAHVAGTAAASERPVLDRRHGGGR